MRTSRVIIALVVLNLGLVLALGYIHQKRSGARLQSAGPASPSASSARVPSREGRQVRTRGEDGEVRSDSKFSWRMLESPDYRQYIANLRAIHCPEETIQDIIISEINKKYAGREAALKLRREHAELWELPALAGSQAAEKQRKLRELLNEKRALIRELLGVEVPLEFPASADYRKNTVFEIALKSLPPEKREQARIIQELYWERSDQLQQRTRGDFEPEDQQELAKIRAERRDALAKLLTPQEFEDLELRTSSTASSLRSQLAGFDPTEQEFRSIFALRRQLDDDFARNTFDPQDREAQKRRNEASQQMDQQIKQLLGDQRYADYQRSQDSNYRTLAGIAQRFNLPKDAAIKGYEIQQSATQEMQRLQADQQLTAEQRNQAMAAIRTETERAFVETLGEKGFTRYKRSNPRWLQVNNR